MAGRIGKWRRHPATCRAQVWSFNARKESSVVVIRSTRRGGCGGGRYLERQAVPARVTLEPIDKETAGGESKRRQASGARRRRSTGGTRQSAARHRRRASATHPRPCDLRSRHDRRSAPQRAPAAGDRSGAPAPRQPCRVSTPRSHRSSLLHYATPISSTIVNLYGPVVKWYALVLRVSVLCTECFSMISERNFTRYLCWALLGARLRRPENMEAWFCTDAWIEYFQVSVSATTYVQRSTLATFIDYRETGKFVTFQMWCKLCMKVMKIRIQENFIFCIVGVGKQLDDYFKKILINRGVRIQRFINFISRIKKIHTTAN